MSRSVFRIALAIAAAAIAAPLSTTAVAGKSAKPPLSAFGLEVPVNIVYVGFHANAVDRTALQTGLPLAGKPRSRLSEIWYGVSGRDLGLRYTYRYRHVSASRQFEDRFFAFLTSTGTPSALGLGQTRYNEQNHRVRDIVGPQLTNEAPSVEAWLADHAGSLGVNTKRGYTVFLINWYGRPDFRFHTYLKTDEPDQDHGYNWARDYPGAGLTGWGGTSSRTWFFDISAGPAYYTYNWQVDESDVDGDGVDDYRIPPIWEYTAGGFRDPSALTADLAKIVRYVAIDMLFTSSPLYDPANTRPGAGGRKIVHVDLFEDDPATNGADFIHPTLINQNLSDLEPYYRWSTRLSDYQPIDPGSERALRIWKGLDNSSDCWNAWGDPWAELFCYYDGNRSAYFPSYGPQDYVAPVTAFQTLSWGATIAGFADDNWTDGTQLFSYLWRYPWPTVPYYVQGFTELASHEMGHHFGLSHPHDGYDSESDVDFSGTDGPFHFAWLGDHSHSVMNYLLTCHGFGQFNKDDMDRWEMAASLQAVDEMRAAISAHPKGVEHRDELQRFLGKRSEILAAFNRWDFREAATEARRLFEAVSVANASVGLPAHRFDAPVHSKAITSFNRYDGRVIDRPSANQRLGGLWR